MKFLIGKFDDLYEKHSFYYFWGFIICCFYAGYELPRLENILSTCFLLILIIGVSHGALDHEKGKKLLNIYKIDNIFYFYFIYLIIAVSISLLWYKFPTFTLILFLLTASYHFGKEDSIYSKTNNSILFALKGSIIIFAPIFLNYDETLNIFKLLNANNIDFFNVLEIFEDNFKLFLIFILFYFFLNFLIFKLYLQFFAFIDLLIIIVLNFFFSTIFAFTFYFCFIHSIRHIISIMIEEKIKVSTFARKAMPLTLLTAIIFITSGWIITLNNISLDVAIMQVIFIGLASLTFPHILLEYLLKKNEKRT